MKTASQIDMTPPQNQCVCRLGYRDKPSVKLKSLEACVFVFGATDKPSSFE